MGYHLSLTDSRDLITLLSDPLWDVQLTPLTTHQRHLVSLLSHQIQIGMLFQEAKEYTCVQEEHYAHLPNLVLLTVLTEIPEASPP